VLAQFTNETARLLIKNCFASGSSPRLSFLLFSSNGSMSRCTISVPPNASGALRKDRFKPIRSWSTPISSCNCSRPASRALRPDRLQNLKFVKEVLHANPQFVKSLIVALPERPLHPLATLAIDARQSRLNYPPLALREPVSREGSVLSLPALRLAREHRFRVFAVNIYRLRSKKQAPQ
jgi:hypothetical protein